MAKLVCHKNQEDNVALSHHNLLYKDKISDLMKEEEDCIWTGSSVPEGMANQPGAGYLTHHQFGESIKSLLDGSQEAWIISRVLDEDHKLFESGGMFHKIPKDKRILNVSEMQHLKALLIIKDGRLIIVSGSGNFSSSGLGKIRTAAGDRDGEKGMIEMQYVLSIKMDYDKALEIVTQIIASA